METRAIRHFSPDDIYVGRRLRDIDVSRVDDLVLSMRQIGLQTPLSIRIVRNMVIDGEEENAVPVLIAGAHRLEAAKRLGWDTIACNVLNADDREAKIWEIVENLHRAELTPLDRADLTAELVRLFSVPAEEPVAEEEAPAPLPDTAAAAPVEEKPREVRAVSRGGRGNTGGVRQAARELGRPETNVRQDMKIAKTAPLAKEAARAAGLEDNQRALLEIAKEPTPEAQVAKVAEIKGRKARKREVVPEPAETAAHKDARQNVVRAEPEAVEPPATAEPKQVDEPAPAGTATPAQTVTIYAADAAIVDKVAGLLINNLPREEMDRLIGTLWPAVVKAITESFNARSPMPMRTALVEAETADAEAAEHEQPAPVDDAGAELLSALGAALAAAAPILLRDAAKPALDPGPAPEPEPAPAPEAVAPAQTAPLCDALMATRKNLVEQRKVSLMMGRGLSEDDAIEKANALIDKLHPELRLPKPPGDAPAGIPAEAA
jgi:ParB-like chromosome segregation protein Spo0J